MAANYGNRMAANGSVPTAEQRVSRLIQQMATLVLQIDMEVGKPYIKFATTGGADADECMRCNGRARLQALIGNKCAIPVFELRPDRLWVVELRRVN